MARRLSSRLGAAENAPDEELRSVEAEVVRVSAEIEHLSIWRPLATPRSGRWPSG
jgi:hypothetical protein